ncbi:hypothetical protein ASPU41_18095 [Arthrobacter sp. U41]|nr:hypothetical protein ASPU41_18095 [Arthrobacter sp. U41]
MRRRDQAAATHNGLLAVPAYLLPITARERRLTALGGEPVPADEVPRGADLLAAWLEDHGCERKDYTTRNAAIRAGSKLKLLERQASHSAPSPRLRKR